MAVRRLVLHVMDLLVLGDNTVLLLQAAEGTPGEISKKMFAAII